MEMHTLPSLSKSVRTISNSLPLSPFAGLAGSGISPKNSECPASQETWTNLSLFDASVQSHSVESRDQGLVIFSSRVTPEPHNRSYLYPQARHPKKLPKNRRNTAVPAPISFASPAERRQELVRAKGIRTPVACVQCRARKTKCRGGNPCQRCTDRGLACTAAQPKTRKSLKQKEFLRQESAYLARQKALQAPVQQAEVPALPFPLLPPHLVAYDPVVRAIYQGRPIPDVLQLHSASFSKPREKRQYFSPTPPRSVASRSSSTALSTPGFKQSQQAQAASPLFIPSRSSSPIDVIMDDDSFMDLVKFEEMRAEMDKFAEGLFSAPQPTISFPPLECDADWLQFLQADDATGFSPGSDAAYADSLLGSFSAASSTASSSGPHTPADAAGRDTGYFDTMVYLTGKEEAFPNLPSSPSMTFTFESLQL